MAMYYAVGKHKDCLPHRSSEQGRPSRPTTAVQQQREARMRSGLSPWTLPGSYCTSPILHSALGVPGVQLRWNLRMLVKNRGLPAALGGHYNEYLVELVQRATADWEASCPVPPQYPAAMDPEGTGERSGLARSLLDSTAT